MTTLCSPPPPICFQIDAPGRNHYFRPANSEKNLFLKTSWHSNRYSHPKRPLFPALATKMHSLASEIRGRYKFQAKPIPYDVLLKRGDKTSSSQLFVPHGAEIINMDILRHVLSLLHSNEPH